MTTRRCARSAKVALADTTVPTRAGSNTAICFVATPLAPGAEYHVTPIWLATTTSEKAAVRSKPEAMMMR
jgi:hypothetical protein